MRELEGCESEYGRTDASKKGSKEGRERVNMRDVRGRRK